MSARNTYCTSYDGEMMSNCANCTETARLQMMKRISRVMHHHVFALFSDEGFTGGCPVPSVPRCDMGR